MTSRWCLNMIAAGELHVSGAHVLVPAVDDHNVDRLLDAASGQTRRKIEEIVAAERPRPDVPTSVRDVSVAGESLAPGLVTADRSEPQYAKVEALAPERYALTVTISKETRDRLQEARDLNRHVVPDGDVATILGMALDLLVEKARKRQFAETDRPRPAMSEPVDRDAAIPAHMRREVGAQDEHQCAFVAEDGTRCGARSWLQLDHIVPRAMGGQTTPSNLRILCRTHNVLEAERKLGAWVTEIPEKKRRQRERVVKQPEAEVFATVREALVFNGYEKREADAALEAIRVSVAPDASAEVVLREALQAIRPQGCREPAPRWHGRDSRHRVCFIDGR